MPMLQDALISRDWWSDSSEWCDSDRKRVCAYEVWYRVWHKGLVIKFADGRVAEYDKRNAMHVAAVATGMAELSWAAYHKMRLAWWVGPFRLMDIESPYGHNEFPYVPFWGKIEDDTRTPYGLIRAMKSPPDEVNARRAKMMWQLSAQRVIAEDDAVDDHDAVAGEVNRPDAYIKLAKNRKQRGSQPPFQIEDHSGLNAQQFSVYEDAKRRIVENRAALDSLVKALVERETLDEEEILEATGITPPPAPEDRPLAHNPAKLPGGADAGAR
jgi:hypothetical protein